MLTKSITLSSHSWNKNKIVLESEDPIEYLLVPHENNGDCIRCMEDKQEIISIDPSGGPMLFINDVFELEPGKSYRIDKFIWRKGGWRIRFTESALG